MSEQVHRVQGNGYCLVFCKDGMCMLRIDSLEREMEDVRVKEAPAGVSIEKRRDLSKRWLSLYGHYAHTLNALQLLRGSALLQANRFALRELTSLRLADVFPIIIDEARIMPVIDYSYGAESFSATRDALRNSRHPWNYDPSLPIEDDKRIARRGETPEGVFRQTVEQFEKAHQDPDAIEVLNETLIALDNFNVANYPVALIQAWFLIELFINKLWIEFLSEQNTTSIDLGPRINKARRDFLTGRVSAAVVSNMLELTGRIDQKTFQQINSLRGVRNQVSHSLDRTKRMIDKKLKQNAMEKESNAVSADDCRTAFQVVGSFIERAYKIQLGITEGAL